MLSRCFLDFSVVVGAFGIGLSQVSSFFSHSNVYFFTTFCLRVFVIAHVFFNKSI